MYSHHRISKSPAGLALIVVLAVLSLGLPTAVHTADIAHSPTSPDTMIDDLVTNRQEVAGSTIGLTPSNAFELGKLEPVSFPGTGTLTDPPTDADVGYRNETLRLSERTDSRTVQPSVVNVTHGPLTATLPISLYLPIVFRAPRSLKDQISTTMVTLPHPLAKGHMSGCTWYRCLLSPRLYHEPIADGRTFVGWTDSSGDGHVSVISGSSIQRTFDFPGTSVLGLVAHDDGTFAVLLWNSDPSQMWLARRSENGNEIWTTEFSSEVVEPAFGLGDSRLAYGNGLYAAYHSVGGFGGHYGDRLLYVDDNGDIQPTGWDWGCSHSIAQLVSYHPDLDKFIAVCASDCYPGKGIVINDQYKVYEAEGNCLGRVSAQLGQLVPGGESWKLLFNALDRSCCEGHGIALATISGNYASSFTWLTDTDGEYERDPSIARLGTDSQVERYLVGWRTTDDQVYQLGIIDGAGNFLAGPEEVTSAGVQWGVRDDSFRTRADGSVSWVQGEQETTQLYLFRFDGSAYLSIP